MDATELRVAWNQQAGNGRQNKDRPAWVRENRDAISEHTDTSDELPPPDAPLAEYRRWLGKYKGAVTRQLKPDDSSDGGGEEVTA